ncbi:hypothetical protein GCM10009414_28220 [Tatumella terrea]
MPGNSGAAKPSVMGKTLTGNAPLYENKVLAAGRQVLFTRGPVPLSLRCCTLLRGRPENPGEPA